MEKMLAFQKEYEANEARKAYHYAMSMFKADPPSIEKDKTVAYGQTRYTHASLANVTEKINTALSKWGLSASWDIKQNGDITVTCKITHSQGHSQSRGTMNGLDLILVAVVVFVIAGIAGELREMYRKGE